MDRDVSEKFAQDFPQVYSTGRLNSQLNIYNVIYWVFNSVIYAVVLCLIMYYVMDLTLINYGIFEFGTFVIGGLVYALTAKVMFYHHKFNYVNVFGLVISLGGTLGYFLLLDKISFWLTNGTYWHVAIWLYQQGAFWFFSLFTVSIVCVMIDFILHSVQYHVAPSEEMHFKAFELAV